MKTSLFDLDVTTSLIEYKESLREASTTAPADIQRKINSIDNLEAYQNHKKNIPIKRLIK